MRRPGRGIEVAEVVEEREIALKTRHFGALETQRVAQRVARQRPSLSDSHPSGQVRDGLLEEVPGQRDRDGVGVLVIDYADGCRRSACGRIGQAARHCWLSASNHSVAPATLVSAAPSWLLVSASRRVW